MNKYDSTIEIFDKKYKIQVVAEDLDSAELQIEECLSVFNRINLYGNIEFDKRYFECVLNGMPLPKEMQHLKIYFSINSINQILHDTRQREESLNKLKKENFYKNRIKFYKKDSNTFGKIIHAFFTAVFLPILLAIKFFKDFFIALVETIAMKNGIREAYISNKTTYKKSLKKQVIKQKKTTNKKKFQFFLLVLFAMNIFIFNIIGFYMYIPIFLILMIYLTIIYKVNRGKK